MIISSALSTTNAASSSLRDLIFSAAWTLAAMSAVETEP